MSAIRGLADILTLLAAFAMSCSFYAWLIHERWIMGDPPRFAPYVTIALVFSGISLVVFARLGLYRRSASVLNLTELKTAAKGIALAAAYLFALLFFLNLQSYSRIAVVGAISVAVVLIILERRILSAMLGMLQLRGKLGSRVLIYGSGAAGRLLMKKIVQAPHIGYHVIGFLDDVSPIGSQIGCRIRQMGPTIFEAPVLGRWKDWRKVVERHGVDDLLITTPSMTPDKVRELLQQTEGSRLRVGIVPHLEAIRPDQLCVDDLSAIPVLRPTSATPSRAYVLAKRMMDLLFGTALVLVTAPLWLSAALLIAIGSAGPILFVQDRVGLGGRKFRMLKFRTMRQETPRYAPSPQGEVDPRITRVGRILRMCGLDELPQLLNVLRGDMSLVGPRPEMPFVVERYSPLERQRLRAKPGITGLWQLSADRHAEIHENIEYDLYYIDHQSLMLDVLILLETLFFTLGLAVTAPLRRSSEDYRPAALPMTSSQGDQRHVLVALDQRHGGVAPTIWRKIVPAAYTLADRWPVKVIATGHNVSLLDRLLDEPIRQLGTHGYSVEYVSYQSQSELLALITRAHIVISDISHIVTMAAEAGVDHLSIERENFRASVMTHSAMDVVAALSPLFPVANGPEHPHLVPGGGGGGSMSLRLDGSWEQPNTAW